MQYVTDTRMSLNNSMLIMKIIKGIRHNIFILIHKDTIYRIETVLYNAKVTFCAV